MSRVADEGLDIRDYHEILLGHLMSRVGGAAQPTPAADLARLDVTLSSDMLRYLHQLHRGRIDPHAIGFRLEAPEDRHDYPALLRAAVAEQRVTEAAAELRPSLPQYQLLRTMLTRYRSLSKDSSIVVPPSVTRAVRPGEPYDANGILYRELVALGDIPADARTPLASEPYGGAIADGVKRFQIRHSLHVDGILGKSTVAALRVPLTWRGRQIELALERLRWLPHVGDQRLIVLNIPAFRFWAWDAIPPRGAPAFGMDVIVGRALNRQTPVFAEEMREVIFRPYWNVPRSILRQEVLPKIERDPDYLRREDMEVVRGAGDSAEHVTFTADAVSGLRSGVLRVRQRPGPKNSLGLIKFVFPNQENVYMHGTPAQVLFARSRRDFSHGCVRVADPVALAEWVLKDRLEWTRDRIVAATTGTQTIHVKMLRPIQVLLFYTTAVVMPEDGTIRFLEDIYRHDARLDRALATRQVAQ